MALENYVQKRLSSEELCTDFDFMKLYDGVPPTSENHALIKRKPSPIQDSFDMDDEFVRKICDGVVPI